MSLNAQTNTTMNDATTTIADYANILKVLGDKTRLSILKILDSTECCVCHFAGMFDMSQSAISQHMKKLKELDLVREEPKKQWVFYSLNPDAPNYEFVKSVLDQIPNDLVDSSEIECNILEMTCS